jgi:hypothetical protein
MWIKNVINPNTYTFYTKLSTVITILTIKISPAVKHNNKTKGFKAAG